MALKKFRPVTPTLRYKTVNSFEELTRSKPEKSLLAGAVNKSGGRNSQGRMTMRRRGGGHKRRYRVIDFKRNKIGVPGRVTAIEYDPNRSAFIALVVYADGDKRYIIAPLGLKVGTQVTAGPDAPIQVGNALPLANIPLGSTIHNVELNPGRGGQLARSAGAAPPAKFSWSRVLALTFVAGCIGARRNLRLTLVRLTVTVAIVLFSLVDYALSVGLGLARAVRHHYRTFGASLAPGGAPLLSTAPPPKTKVVVIGGSFAGLRVQRELSDDFDVTVVDLKQYFEYTPGVLRLYTQPKVRVRVRVRVRLRLRLRVRP